MRIQLKQNGVWQWQGIAALLLFLLAPEAFSQSPDAYSTNEATGDSLAQAALVGVGSTVAIVLGRAPQIPASENFILGQDIPRYHSVTPGGPSLQAELQARRIQFMGHIYDNRGHELTRWVEFRYRVHGPLGSFRDRTILIDLMEYPEVDPFDPHNRHVIPFEAHRAEGRRARLHLIEEVLRDGQVRRISGHAFRATPLSLRYISEAESAGQPILMPALRRVLSYAGGAGLGLSLVNLGHAGWRISSSTQEAKSEICGASIASCERAGALRQVLTGERRVPSAEPAVAGR